MDYNDLDDSLYFVPTLPFYSKRVKKCISLNQFSHRSDEFFFFYNKTTDNLTKYIDSNLFVPLVISGCGTFANEIMLANMIESQNKSIILTNGEFGDRLAKQANFYSSQNIVLDFGFGNNFNLDELQNVIEKEKNIVNLFFVACETSIGLINPIDKVCQIANEFGIKVGIDAISALGSDSFNFNYSNISCITCTSGKALGAIPGLAIIFANPNNILHRNDLQDILNLNRHLAIRNSSKLIVNTVSSLLLIALNEAISEKIEIGLPDYYSELKTTKNYIINELSNTNVFAIENSNSPIVTTFTKPEQNIWYRIKKEIKTQKTFIYSSVSYLEQRNLFQIATMGLIEKEKVDILLSVFNKIMNESASHDNINYK